MIIKKNSSFIISRNTCKKLAEHRLRISDLQDQFSLIVIAINNFIQSSIGDTDTSQIRF